MKTFWQHIGMGLAKVAQGAARGALWASQHPQVIAAVAQVTGHPDVAAVITAVGSA